MTEVVKPRPPVDRTGPPVSPSPAIELLVERARRGDPRAFRELMDSYRTAFYGLARRYVGTHEDADDVLQESFVKVYQNLRCLTQSDAFFPWARRIIVNTALDHLRRRRRASEVEMDGIDHPEVTGRESAFEPPDRGVERREFLGRLERALRALPPRQREVVVLHDVEGLSTREVAERCGLPPATVRSNLFYGREKLRRMLVEHRT
ncbi:MAG TPA: RNA polymerase sigma factor [Gemmatimonadota bacterium]|nr:RNA polymerase sigma factor [Gemmatimonadota bacterium]